MSLFATRIRLASRRVTATQNKRLSTKEINEDEEKLNSLFSRLPNNVIQEMDERQNDNFDNTIGFRRIQEVLCPKYPDSFKTWPTCA